MAMFGRFEDWGLQAVVRASGKIEKMENLQEQCSLGIRGMPQDDQDFLLGFSDLFAKSSSSTIRWGDGLESLYKPFYPVKYSTSTELLNPGATKEVKNEEEVQSKQGPNQEVILDQSSSSVLAVSYSPRFKKRKNQQKRVITQVKAEDYLTSDMWAWRKYGQKPIKGSPYPRSYYRCSSMKGCQARKQVEQSCTDPEVYVVTYTEEHCHSQPTRRNSLAGTVRNKFPVIPKSPTAATARGNNSLPLASNHQEIISSSSKSPPLNECTEEELSEKNLKQQKILDEELRTVEWGLNNNNCDPFLIPEFLMPDDFFSGLGDLDGPEL